MWKRDAIKVSSTPTNSYPPPKKYQIVVKSFLLSSLEAGQNTNCTIIYKLFWCVVFNFFVLLYSDFFFSSENWLFFYYFTAHSSPFFCRLLSSGLQTMMPSQQPTYQGIMGVQQPQNPGLLNSQRAGMGGQIQSIMVQYPQMQSYQVWMDFMDGTHLGDKGFFLLFFLNHVNTLFSKKSFEN